MGFFAQIPTPLDDGFIMLAAVLNNLLTALRADWGFGLASWYLPMSSLCSGAAY